ncbi:MAG: type II toxin-antitoxin system RelB/DinJ family antitoxin [Chitinispirillales bacterium]|nr:type II toxin-antitoxin system RelB/DinJ family antitoxin [Chitinispirillales bacterium]
MAQVSVNIRMDEGLKRDFESVCGDMGLTMASAFTVFARAVSRQKNIGVLDVALGEDYAEIGTLTVKETAGIGNKWANPALVSLERSAWREATVEKEFHKREGFQKHGNVER